MPAPHHRLRMGPQLHARNLRSANIDGSIINGSACTHTCVRAWAARTVMREREQRRCARYEHERPEVKFSEPRRERVGPASQQQWHHLSLQDEVLRLLLPPLPDAAGPRAALPSRSRYRSAPAGCHA
jgi:hypothetical protein